MGSSPLARGLLEEAGWPVVTHRIIPARAGFTARCYCPSCSSWDHPRSRGVYNLTPHTLNVRAGSSPLARGLLVLSRDDSGEPGIIPARAGFTTGRMSTSP